MSGGFADINGAKINYEFEGTGSALVMIHAGIADLRMWDDQFLGFAQNFKTIRYDMRGYGKTAPVEGDYSSHEDLYALLQYLHIEKAFVMGCSKGGSVAMDFTLQYPEMTSALIMVCSAPAGFEYESPAPTPPIWDELVAAWKAGNVEKVAALDMQINVVGLTRTPNQVDASVRDKVIEMNLIALKNEQLGLGKKVELDPPAAQRLGEIKVPTLLIVGQYDLPDVIAAGDFMAANITGAQKIVMPTGHIPSMERPHEFSQQVRNFLQGLQ
ncbi:MAG: alpha/beta hydrolase [Chloroflexota bacterium]